MELLLRTDICTSGRLLLQRLDDLLGDGWWLWNVITGGLESILVGHIVDGDDLTVGRWIRVGSGLDNDFLLFLLASWDAVLIQDGNEDLLKEALAGGLDSVTRLVAKQRGEDGIFI